VGHDSLEPTRSGLAPRPRNALYHVKPADQGATPLRSVKPERRASQAITMSAVRPCEVPLNSLLRNYKDADGFTDCYVAEVPGEVTQQAFIVAFYTSPLFKIERAILKYLAARPASDADAEQLSMGKTGRFSAWRVEGQSSAELLLADVIGRTRSWLMAAPAGGPAPAPSTLLYFGSAVVPRRGKGAGKPGMGWPFHALLGLHRLYSRWLLLAASKRVGSA